QRAARDHDAAIAHAGHHVLALYVIREGDRGVACVRPVCGADLELAVQHDPLGGQLEVGVVREDELAVDREPCKRRRADVEDHFLVPGDDDLFAFRRHLAVRPGAGIGPSQRTGRRRSGILSLRDREDAAEQHCRNERTKKERATLLAHQITSPHWKTIRTSRKPPAARRGLYSSGSSPHRLTSRLSPGPGPRPGPLPGTSPVET